MSFEQFAALSLNGQPWQGVDMPHLEIEKSDLVEDELLRYRLRLFGPPVYTKRFFEQLETYSLEMNGTEPFQTTIRTCDPQGNERWIVVNGGNKMWVLPSYHQWAMPRTYWPKLACDPGFEDMLHRVIDFPTLATDMQPGLCCKLENDREFFETMRQQWKRSPLYVNLVARLIENAGRMPWVNNIICFGLGPFQLTEGVEDHIARPWLQFAAALEIRDVLEAKHPPGLRGTRRIHITVQDPSYCPNCKSIMYDYEDVCIATTPTAFSFIDGHSFIISKYPSVAVRQIVGDMTYWTGGPAGMLCDPIVDDGLSDIGQSIGQCQTADPSSPKLLDFARNRSNAYTFNDTNYVLEFNGNVVAGTVFDQVDLYLRKL
ncbi:Nn.00g059410.m01.CDS01 [Neocucurbitaria sp. VM-36]